MKKFGGTFTGAGAPGNSQGTGGVPNVPTAKLPNAGKMQPKFPMLGQAVQLGQNTGMVPKSLPGGITHKDIEQHGFPGLDKDLSSFADASNIHKTVTDLNSWQQGLKDNSLMSQDYWDSADKLDGWLTKHKDHPLVQKLMADPNISNQVSMYRGPMGQIGRTVAPAVGNFMKDPKQFAQILGVPGIKEIYQNTLGHAGTPGLALAHSVASGDMKDWNTLTAGLWDPSKRVKKADAMDRHIARIAGKL